MADPLSSSPNSSTSTNTDSSPSSNITSVINNNYKGIPLLFSTITTGSIELTEIAELIKVETEGNVIIELDKNTYNEMCNGNKTSCT